MMMHSKMVTEQSSKKQAEAAAAEANATASEAAATTATTSKVKASPFKKKGFTRPTVSTAKTPSKSAFDPSKPMLTEHKNKDDWQHQFLVTHHIKPDLPNGTCGLEGIGVTATGYLDAVITKPLFNRQMPGADDYFEKTGMLMMVFSPRYGGEGGEQWPHKSIRGVYPKKMIVVQTDSMAEGLYQTKDQVLDFVETTFLPAMQEMPGLLFDGKTAALAEDPNYQYIEYACRWSQLLTNQDITMMISTSGIKDKNVSDSEFLKSDRRHIYSIWREGDVPDWAIKRYKLVEADLDPLDHATVASLAQKPPVASMPAKSSEDEADMPNLDEEKKDADDDGKETPNGSTEDGTFPTKSPVTKKANTGGTPPEMKKAKAAAAASAAAAVSAETTVEEGDKNTPNSKQKNGKSSNNSSSATRGNGRRRKG